MITNARKTEHTKVVSPRSIKGHIVIDGKAYPVDEVIEAALSESYSELKHDGNNIILGRRKISPIYKSEQEKAMAALCYGSLIYCCPASKPCPERDHALKVLGISLEEYDKLKERFHYMMLDYAHGLWSPDEEINNRQPTRQPRTDEYTTRTYQRERPEMAINREREQTQVEPEMAGNFIPQARDDSWEDMLDFPDLFDEDGRPKDSRKWVRTSTTPAGIQPIGTQMPAQESQRKRNIPRGLSAEVGFCLNCGAPIPKGATYCKKCGHPI